MAKKKEPAARTPRGTPPPPIAPQPALPPPDNPQARQEESEADFARNAAAAAQRLGALKQTRDMRTSED
jgi:hypothetical protein